MENPFAGLAGLLDKKEPPTGPDCGIGHIDGVQPLKVRLGELELDAGDVTLCAHVTLPAAPGGRLLLISLDGGQTYYAVGRC